MKIRQRAAEFGRRLAAEFGPREWHVYGGILLLFVGCSQVSGPLGLGVTGALLLAMPAYLRWLAGGGAGQKGAA